MCRLPDAWRAWGAGRERGMVACAPSVPRPSAAPTRPLYGDIVGGVTTFFTMAYIVVVNPAILATAGTGMPFSGALTATVLVASTMTLLMGLYAGLPFAVAPGMGLNAFFAFTIVLQNKVPWQTALGMVFWAGVLFLVVSTTPLRERIAMAIPAALRSAAAAGIGLLLTFIGLRNAGLVVGDPATLVRMGVIDHRAAFLLLGILVAAALMRRQNPLAFLAAIASVTALAWGLGFATRPAQLVSAPDFSSTFLALDIRGALNLALLPSILAILFTDLFDSLSTFIGVATAAGLTGPDGSPINLRRGLIVDALATLTSGIAGTSPGTAYVESIAGIRMGARTGRDRAVLRAVFLPRAAGRRGAHLRDGGCACAGRRVDVPIDLDDRFREDRGRAAGIRDGRPDPAHRVDHTGSGVGVRAARAAVCRRRPLARADGDAMAAVGAGGGAAAHRPLNARDAARFTIRDGVLVLLTVALSTACDAPVKPSNVSLSTPRQDLAAVRMSGRALDYGTDAGVAGATVAVGELGFAGQFVAETQAVTDAAGSYTLTVRPGSYFAAVGGEFAGSINVTGVGTRSDFFVRAGTCVSRYGVIADTQTHRPIAGAIVTFAGPGIGQAAISDADGAYRIDLGCPANGMVGSNTTDLRVVGSGYVTASKPVGRGVSGVRRLDVFLGRRDAGS
jgi:AGZA family xanthine/uracil permease-like MFS transporter